jgi:hypothetical protein
MKTALRGNPWKFILTVAGLCMAATSYAQTMPNRSDLQGINALGYRWQTGAFMKGFWLPQDTLSATDVGAIAYINGVVYKKDVGKWNPISGGATGNIATAAQTATGNYTHNWNHFQLYLDSISNLRVSSFENDATLTGNKHSFLFSHDNDYMGMPLMHRWAVRDVSGLNDSVGGGMYSDRFNTELEHFGGNGSFSRITMIGNNNFPAIQMQAYSGFLSSSIRINHNWVSIFPQDSLCIKMPDIGTAAYFIGAIPSVNGMSRIVRVPVSSISGGGGQTLGNTTTTGEPWITSNYRMKRIRSNKVGVLPISANDSVVLLDPDSTFYMETIYRANKRVADTAAALRTAIAGAGVSDGDKGDFTVASGVWTIDNNVVTDNKLRQSAGNSVIGRASGTTGNVADIVATVTSTYLTKGSGGTLLFDSIDFGHIKNAPQLQNPGVYFSPAASFDPTFVVFASAIIYPNNAYSFGQPINWQILDQGSLHNSSFFDSAGYNSSTDRLKAFFPRVRMVINTTITPDESFSSRCVVAGPSVALDFWEAPIYSNGTMGLRLVGDGSNNWVKNFGYASKFSVEAYNPANGRTRFDVPTSGGAFNYDPDAMSVVYTGKNGYKAARVYSALGSYTAGFILQDQSGNAVTAAPTSDDEVQITNAGQLAVPISAYLYNASNSWMAENFNFWTFGVFECYLVAAPTSTTSCLVRYQTNYPSATNYKIYRSITKYGTRTLVHTGTDGSFTDTGLSPATKYYYHMVGVISGVDTDITYFTTNTR